jgi:hypothetical protein
MKIQILLLLLFAIAFGKKETNAIVYITFSNEKITVSGSGATVSGTTVTIESSGTYFVQGSADEGNLVVTKGSVVLYLQHLDLSSKTTAPITINSKLEDVQIINIQNTTLRDYEDESTTSGECAVIKIKKKTTVSFENQGIFTLYGECKNVIKGGAEASLIFVSSNGEYKVTANKNAIASDGYIEFNLGKYTIVSKNGDAIKSNPEDTDTASLGKILINSGTFNIECLNDAFTAKKNITIVQGTFDIKTENGYDSTTFDKDASSAKGFKIKSNDTGCEMKVYDGDFKLNTADDAFHSNRDLIILRGKYEIYAGDDGVHAEFNLVLGEKDAPNDLLDLEVLYSYEAIEGMTITVYSGYIVATATDDGINAAGGDGNDWGPGPFPPGPWPPWNDTRKHNLREPGPGPGPGPFPPGGRGNASYYISIYGGDVNVFCDGDGIDSNGNIFIHGGDIKVFSQGNRDNEPVDHDGNFTLFNGEILGVGSQGMECIHEGIKKGNEMYAYYKNSISKDKTLIIKNENNEIVKTASITKDINYIFYSSLKVNKNYRFYIDDNGSQTELTFTFGTPEEGEDDEDVHDDEYY